METEQATSEQAISGQAQLERAFAAIDAANAADPNTTAYDGEEQPKELCHSLLATKWLGRLAPEATEAQKLAARAHHLRRWEIPRDTYPKDRAGYLRWRTELGRFHAEETAKLLREVGYDAETIERVKAIIRKRNLKSDTEVQTHEDVLCLVFLSTQLDLLAAGLETEKLIEVLAKSLNKMSEEGRQQALRLSLNNAQRGILARALTLSKSL